MISEGPKGAPVPKTTLTMKQNLGLRDNRARTDSSGRRQVNRICVRVETGSLFSIHVSRKKKKKRSYRPDLYNFI